MPLLRGVVASGSSSSPEEIIRALPLGLLAVAALVVGLLLVRHRQESPRVERSPTDATPHVELPLDLDLVRSAGL
jgi:hypothetical protein